MRVESVSNLRRNLAAVLDQVVADAQPVIVPRADGHAVVIVDKAEWDNMCETLHILNSRDNARGLLSSMDELDQDRTVTMDDVKETPA